MITVLIVDDSPTARLALRQGLSRDPELHVVGEASNGTEALAQIRRHQPKLVTMDVYLKRENGIDITETIMSTAPRPVLIVTGVSPKDPRLIYRALQAGAVDVAPKLPAPTHPSYEGRRSKLARMVKTLAQVPVVTRHRRKDLRSSGQTAPVSGARGVSASGVQRPPRPGVLLIGASTGGPPLVKEILEGLGAPYPIPIAVAQHIATGFGQGLGSWIRQATGHEVAIVERPRPLRPGEVYLADEGRHINLPGANTIAPLDDPARTLCPSIDLLFQSAARRIQGGVAAILLTGMGRDGAQGLNALRQAGATTIVQAPDTCVVPGMPQAAIDAGAAGHVLAPTEIIAMLRAFKDTT